MRLASIASVIKSYLATVSPSSSSPDDIPNHMVPTDDDFNATLKVLRYLQLPQVGICPCPTTPLETVVESVKSQLSRGAHLRDAINQQHSKRRRHCYVCRFIITSPHLLYPSLCAPCGEFNISSSSLSLPSNLNLVGKTALITGGRTNLGYHTALRLLRCGAAVVVSTRYPMDAESRYLDEHDSQDWKERLKIIGADFRTAKDVFALINAVLTCLKDWSFNNNAKLDILINNAAQTLTDAVEKEGEDIQREMHLGSVSKGTFLLDAGYAPRVRGGVNDYQYQLRSASPTSSSQSSVKNFGLDANALAASKDMKSSWVQHISEIPYEDVISAHSVNAFVPFILVRELLPYISTPLPSSSESPVPPDATDPKPSGYIVNVSSREGLFENTPGHSAKGGHHVHTNMSKAALNMLTETQAESAWRNGRVAMNTVDPGYMSADPMYMEMLGRLEEICPLGWEDGAGRVLWPVAKGEQGHTIRGRFLKHFQVDMHATRG
ncbi:hypothetical protein BDZ97DRAFT_901932 [Flammula alnicola]|nr:hypothetical protein BDZ97DRAFT_901932 [Flammula alnicola]